MQQCFEFLNGVTVLDAIGWIVKAWDDIHTDTILKCFKICCFGVTDEGETSATNEQEYSEDYAYYQGTFDLVDESRCPLLDA